MDFGLRILISLLFIPCSILWTLWQISLFGFHSRKKIFRPGNHSGSNFTPLTIPLFSSIIPYMNDRLKELMIEAGYAAPEVAGRAQKLAELIVRECADLLED